MEHTSPARNQKSHAASLLTSKYLAPPIPSWPVRAAARRGHDGMEREWLRVPPTPWCLRGESSSRRPRLNRSRMGTRSTRRSRMPPAHFFVPFVSFVFQNPTQALKTRESTRISGMCSARLGATPVQSEYTVTGFRHSGPLLDDHGAQPPFTPVRCAFVLWAEHIAVVKSMHHHRDPATTARVTLVAIR